MRRKIHCLPLIVATALAGAIAGCATVPPPLQLMDRAQAEIRGARNAGAATTAPDALAEAERRLAAAQQFAASNDNAKAADKAAEAEAAAATARARAELASLNRQIEQQTGVNEALQADVERRQEAAAKAQQAAMTPAPASASSSHGPMTLPPIQLGLPAAGSSAPPPPTSAPSDEAPTTLPPIQLESPPIPSGAPASGASAGLPGTGAQP